MRTDACLVDAFCYFPCIMQSCSVLAVADGAEGRRTKTLL